MKWHLTSVQPDWQRIPAGRTAQAESNGVTQLCEISRQSVCFGNRDTRDCGAFAVFFARCSMRGGGGADDVLFKSTSFLLGIYSTFGVMLWSIPARMMMMRRMMMMGWVARTPLPVQANKCEIVIT